MKNKNIRANHHALQPIIESHIALFVTSLKTAGYAQCTLCTKRAALRRYVKWRYAKPEGNEPDEAEVSEFMANACQLSPRHRCLASTALLSFLEHLRRHAVIKTCAPQNLDTVSSALQRRYANFLRDEKGLAELSIKVYLPVVDDLLQYMAKEHGTTALRRLDAIILRAFLLERSRERSSESVRLLAISLRSFLRFLHAQGKIHKDLTAAIPTVRKWSQADVPKKLTPAEVVQVLRTPDQGTAKGRRDYAILLLLAKLGLRSSEIISLELGDIRWRSGEILIRGKGGRLDLLPLPHQVGAAIARYLRLDRGSRATERVFLRSNAPRVPLTGPAAIGHIVRGVMLRAGVARPRQIAAHLFRHTLASRMLQQGANLRDISEALRHRAYSTTEIYAKIDLRSLQEVVRPWPVPGGAQ
jgi:integrase/recombinase XerD